MTEQRFTILSSYLGLYTVFDNENYEPLAHWEVTDLMNKLVKENEQLKSDNFNLNKTVECLDEIVKEQCNKIDWADECGVRWEEEYNKWIGGLNE